MSYQIRRNGQAQQNRTEVEIADGAPVVERQTELVKAVPLDKFVHFYGNDPDRTNRALSDFQELVKTFRLGLGVRGPVRAIYDSRNDRHLLINGHRNTEASKDAGFKTIDVFVIHPFPGEDPVAAQETLFCMDNKNRPYKGKAMLRTAIKTNGRLLMSSDIKRVWGIIQKYNPGQTDLDWMAVNAAPDLVKITEEVVNYVALARMKVDDEPSPFYFRKALFITAMGVLKRENGQRETRDYVQDHLLKPNRVLERALLEGKLPDAVLTASQKRKADEADREKKKAKAAKRAKARAQGLRF